jgi:hypothetical protein
MGLAVEVGLLSLHKKNGSDAEIPRNEFNRLTDFLAENGYKDFHEPEDCPTVSYGMYGYSGLHYLRRIAAHLDLKGLEPAPGKFDGVAPDQDAVLAEYYKLADAKVQLPQRRFDHLICHSDAEGFYVPIDFIDVLTDSTKTKVWGEFVGSSYRLAEECQVLANFLQLPLDLDPEDVAFFDAVDSQGIGEHKWQKYGVESFTCIRLLNAARHSIETGAAIVFC